jgi:hypothetical protein
MIMVNNVDKFWFWTVQYASEYTSEMTLAEGLHNLRPFLFKLVPQLPVYLLALSGLPLLWIGKMAPKDKLFISGLLLFSCLSVCPGLYFRGHYFIMILPAVSILIGSAYADALHILSARQSSIAVMALPVMMFVMAIGYGCYQEKEYLFFSPPQEVSRSIYGANPFPEALPIAKYIKERTRSDDKIAVLGCEPEIFFYANRLSATGHICMYGLMENQPYAKQMQLDAISEIESSRPAFIVTANIKSSWLIKPTSTTTILIWAQAYLEQQYALVGVIDIINANTTRYVWDDAAAGYTPVSMSSLFVYKRKNE